MKTNRIINFFFLISDSSDIVDCKLKLILGLIWTLILHYSISMPDWGSEVELNGTGSTPKQRYKMHSIKRYVYINIKMIENCF